MTELSAASLSRPLYVDTTALEMMAPSTHLRSGPFVL